MIMEFPTKEDWIEIEKTYPFKRLKIKKQDFRLKPVQGFKDVIQMTRNIEIFHWKIILNNRLCNVIKSYVMLMFYYGKGIPDDEWYISPGKKGMSVQFFPHFKKQHFIIKASFNYYADIFFYMIFSSWDTLWQLLNVFYDLGLKENDVNLDIFYQKIKDKNVRFHKFLTKLKGDHKYKKIKDLRRSITHIVQTGEITSGVDRTKENKIRVGIGKYIPSKEIVNSVMDALNLFAETIDKAIETSK